MRKCVITLDAKRCIGCGLCEHQFPTLFRLGRRVARLQEQGVADLCDRDGGIDEISLQRLRILSDQCPAGAIGLPGVSSTKER